MGIEKSNLPINHKVFVYGSQDIPEPRNITPVKPLLIASAAVTIPLQLNVDANSISSNISSISSTRL